MICICWLYFGRTFYLAYFCKSSSSMKSLCRQIIPNSFEISFNFCPGLGIFCLLINIFFIFTSDLVIVSGKHIFESKGRKKGNSRNRQIFPKQKVFSPRKLLADSEKESDWSELTMRLNTDNASRLSLEVSDATAEPWKPLRQPPPPPPSNNCSFKCTFPSSQLIMGTQEIHFSRKHSRLLLLEEVRRKRRKRG